MQLASDVDPSICESDLFSYLRIDIPASLRKVRRDVFCANIAFAESLQRHLYPPNWITTTLRAGLAKMVCIKSL
jgi:hypothetical protein